MATSEDLAAYLALAEEVAREADVGAFECGLELLREVVGAAVDDIKTAVLC